MKVKKYELTVTDIGNLAIDLVDAATIVIGTPTVHFGPHPAVYSATHLANALRPKLKYAAIIGSYGWGTKAVEQISGLIPNLKAEVLGTVMCKGKPGRKTWRNWMPLPMQSRRNTGHCRTELRGEVDLLPLFLYFPRGGKKHGSKEGLSGRQWSRPHR